MLWISQTIRITVGRDGGGGGSEGDGLKGTNNLFVHQSQTIHPSPFNVAHARVVFRLLIVDSHTKIRNPLLGGDMKTSYRYFHHPF
jgi:hypothetical protein